MRSFALTLIIAVASADYYSHGYAPEWRHPHGDDKAVHGHFEGEHYRPIHEEKFSHFHRSEHEPVPAVHELRHPASHSDFREAVGAGSFEGATVTDTYHEPSFRHLSRHYEGAVAEHLPSYEGRHGYLAGDHGYGSTHGAGYGHGYGHGLGFTGEHGRHVTSEHRWAEHGAQGDVERVDQHQVAYVPTQHWETSHHEEPQYAHSQVHFDTHHDTHIAPEHRWDEPVVAKEYTHAPVHDAQIVPDIVDQAVHTPVVHDSVYADHGYAYGDHSYGHAAVGEHSYGHAAVGEHAYGHAAVGEHAYGHAAVVEPVHHAQPEYSHYSTLAGEHGYAHGDYGYGEHGRAYGHEVVGAHHADADWAPHSYRVHDTPHYEPYHGYESHTYSVDHRSPRHSADDHRDTHSYEGHQAFGEHQSYDEHHEREGHHDLHYEPYHSHHDAPHTHHEIAHHGGARQDTHGSGTHQAAVHHDAPVHPDTPLHHESAPHHTTHVETVHHAPIVHHEVPVVHHTAALIHEAPVHHAVAVVPHEAGHQVADHDVHVSAHHESKKNWYSESERREPVHEESPHGVYHYLGSTAGGFNLGSTAGGFNLGSTAGGFLQ